MAPSRKGRRSAPPTHIVFAAPLPRAAGHGRALPRERARSSARQDRRRTPSTREKNVRPCGMAPRAYGEDTLGGWSLPGINERALTNLEHLKTPRHGRPGHHRQPYSRVVSCQRWMKARNHRLACPQEKIQRASAGASSAGSTTGRQTRRQAMRPDSGSAAACAGDLHQRGAVAPLPASRAGRRASAFPRALSTAREGQRPRPGRRAVSPRRCGRGGRRCRGDAGRSAAPVSGPDATRKASCPASVPDAAARSCGSRAHPATRRAAAATETPKVRCTRSSIGHKVVWSFSRKQLWMTLGTGP